MRTFCMLAAAAIAATASANLFDANEVGLNPYFNMKDANTSVWFSAAAYCGEDLYPTHVFKGPTTGFKMYKTISATRFDVEGYMGYLPSENRIYVVYRGSSSIYNWIENFEAWKCDTDAYCSGCRVHSGFYNGEQNVIGDIITWTRELKSKYPTASIRVTGHSLGAALATLTAIDLNKAGLTSSLYNFGSPRVGNDKFSSYLTSYMPTAQRITHWKDMVPHVPYQWMGFVHITSETYEDEAHVLHACSGPEDESCSMQYEFYQTRIDPHLEYLGLSLDCKTVS